MYTDTLTKCGNNALRIKNLIQNHPISFWIGGMMAGAYVGLGIILIFTLGNQVDPSIRYLVMGATFGIALTLVIIAGAELFTGHTMYLTVGIKTKQLHLIDAVKILPQTWFANLIGAIIVSYLYYLGGFPQLFDEHAVMHKIALTKATTPAFNLFMKGILCNWLVCLSIWMAMRVEGTAKFIAIWWCLLGFIASGYEHSVANMSVFALSWLGNHPIEFTTSGIGHNLLWVTLGNTLSGVLFMGLGYWYATPKDQRPNSLK
ncbi:nitrite transporter NirC [Thorsellia anophelis]|uniref:Nitrite transporter NirC n=1 Tax=Thorsellia anophelis DSM 18579 TaxID=1123402 RepID=A0A1I0F5Y5_9GAMM|nr:nitrite transporter NirC [Thorsellia anophelis]SET52486.1 nitrite transporter NirC [Thorsellia anophelis DSM 18579]